MITENVSQTNINGNNQKDFVDKLISLKGLLKITLFFTIQVGLLLFQLKSALSPYSYSYNYDIWTVNSLIWNNILVNYFVFALILLFIFAFYLGKELRMKGKEKFVFFSFKVFIFGTIFLLLNVLILFSAISFENLALANTSINGSIVDYFITGPAYLLFFLWFFIILSFLTIKFVSFWVHLFSRKDKNQKKNQVETIITHPEQKPITTVSSLNSPNNYQSSPQYVNISNGPKQNEYLTKEQIRQLQISKQDEYKNTMQKSATGIEPSSEQNSKPVRDVKPSTPMPIIRFLEKNLFDHSLFEQTIIFFMATELFFLALFSIDLFSATNGFAQMSGYRSQFLTGISNYSIMEFIFYFVSCIVYYDIQRRYLKLDYVTSRNRSFYLLGLGASIVFLSAMIASVFINDNIGILSFIVLKLLLLLLIPTFYFGIKSQDQIQRDSITKINPVFSYFYKKSMKELRSNEKSGEIIKKFLQTHKEDIKRSLAEATPVNFKENIKGVIVKDYDRLETLLTYNNIKVNSKIATIDYTMEIFSTFLINLEVNLQDSYTEHLLKSSSDNIHNPIGKDFIESKFAKLFSQWESLDYSP